MSSPGKDGVADDSVICLDSSIEESAIEIDSACDQSVSEFMGFDKTLPPGVAPDGFIIVDETEESDKVNDLETAPQEDKKPDETEKPDKTEKPMFKIVFGDESISRYKIFIENSSHPVYFVPKNIFTCFPCFQALQETRQGLFPQTHTWGYTN